MKIQIWCDQDILIDGITRNKLCDIITAAEEQKKDRLDVITQRKIDAIDKELFAAGLQIIKEKTQHLKEKDKERMRRLFIKYQVIWLKSKEACCTKHMDQYKVEGEPV